jgi:ATP-dependent DNA ligase
MVTQGTVIVPRMGCANGGDADSGNDSPDQSGFFERKLDGIRLLAFKNAADVKLYSRNRLPQHYPASAEAIAQLPARNLSWTGRAAWDAFKPALPITWFDILMARRTVQ